MSRLDVSSNDELDAGGYRSVIAASLIKRQGIHNLRNVVGGWNKIRELGDKFEIEKSAEIVN